MMLSSAAASHRNIFILRQAETMSDRSSSLEINLPGHMNSIGNVVTDTHKSLFRQQGSSSVFKADRLTEMVFLDLLASMRTAGWTIFASNAYFDTSGKSCIKTFYFSEDIYMSKLNSIEQIIKQLKASGIATSGIANATDEEAAALTTSTAHEELIAVANDPTANLPFMAKLKIVSESHESFFIRCVYEKSNSLYFKMLSLTLLRRINNRRRKRISNAKKTKRGI